MQDSRALTPWVSNILQEIKIAIFRHSHKVTRAHRMFGINREEWFIREWDKGSKEVRLNY